jgi:hypothetical protein
MCSTDLKLMMLHNYETKFGIYDHDKSDDTRDPLALVRMHWGEDTISTSRLSERDKQFIDLEIHRYTGLNLVQFLELPTWRCASIMSQCADKLREKNTPAGRLKTAVEELIKPPE